MCPQETPLWITTGAGESGLGQTPTSECSPTSTVPTSSTVRNSLLHQFPQPGIVRGPTAKPLTLILSPDFSRQDRKARKGRQDRILAISETSRNHSRGVGGSPEICQHFLSAEGELVPLA